MGKVLRTTALATVILAILAAALMAGCSTTTSQKATTGEEQGAATVYVNPQLLTETDALEKEVGSADLAIIDVRTPDLYAAGHIKGAVNMPGHSTDETVGAVPSMLASPEKIAKMLGERGVSNDANVVIYDDQITPLVGRTFWFLEYLGHKKVSVLDGGLAKWKKEGKEVTKEAPTVKPAAYTPALDDAVFATKDEIKAMMGNEGAVLVDTRPVIEYLGGHIEGAKRIDWIESVNKDGTMKPAGDLEKVYADAGVTKDKDVGLY